MGFLFFFHSLLIWYSFPVLGLYPGVDFFLALVFGSSLSGSLWAVLFSVLANLELHLAVLVFSPGLSGTYFASFFEIHVSGCLGALACLNGSIARHQYISFSGCRAFLGSNSFCYPYKDLCTSLYTSFYTSFCTSLYFFLFIQKCFSMVLFNPTKTTNGSY